MLGPWLALAGLLIPFFAFFPFPPFAALWRMRRARFTARWSWRGLLRVQTLALPVAMLALCAGLLTVVPHDRAIFRAVLALPLIVVVFAVSGAVEIRPVARSGGQVTGDSDHLEEPHDQVAGAGDHSESSGGQAAGTGGHLPGSGSHLDGSGSHLPGSGGHEETITGLPAAPSMSSLVVKALLTAALSGAYAWAIRTALRLMLTGDRRPISPEAERAARWADAQVASSLFGPTYDRQWYWAVLVGAAALLAVGCALLLRNSLLRAAAKTDPFDGGAGADEGPAESTSKVFLSYSRKDTEFARRLCDRLEERLGELWVDWQAISPSEEWRESISRAVRTSDAFVVLLSREALASTYCWDEVRQAIELRKRILPVVIDPALERGSTSGVMRERGWSELTAYQNLSLVEPDEDELAQGVEDIAAFVHQHHRWAAFHSRLAVLAHQWWEGGRSDGLLLRADELSVAEAWRRHTPDEDDFRAGLTERQRHYLEASRTSVRRRALRVRSALAAGTAVVVLLSGLVAAGQAGAEDQYRAALSRKLAALSGDVADTDPEKAVQYALAARGQADTAEARNAVAEQLDEFDSVRTVVAPRGATVEQLALSRKGDVLLIDRDTSTEVWDVKRARSRGLLPGSLLYSQDGPRSLSADGRTMAVLSVDGAQVDLVDTRTLQVKDSFTAAEGGVGGRFVWGALSADGRHLLAGSLPSSPDEPSDVVWDVRRHRSLGTLDCLATLAPSGRRVLCEDDDRPELKDVADLEDPDSEQHTRAFDAKDSSFVAFTADDGMLFNVSGETRLYGPGGEHPEVPVPGKAVVSREGGGPAVLDGRYAVFAHAGEKPFELWDLPDHRRIKSADSVEEAIGAGKGRKAPEFDRAESDAEADTPHGSLVATAAADGSVVLWNKGGSGGVSKHLPVPGQKGQYAISPDARTVASATSRGVSTWDTRTGRRTGKFEVSGIKGALALDRHGSMVAVATGDRSDQLLKLRVEVFRIRDGRRISRLDAGADSKNHVASLVFSPDGRQLYAALTGQFKVVAWDMAHPARRPRTVARTDGYADDVALSADGTTLAATGRGGTISVRDAPSGRLLRTVRNASGSASGSALSPDGGTLATVFYPGRSVELWNVRTGRRSSGELVPQAGAYDVQFSADGRRLAVVGYPDRGLVDPLPVTLWDLSSRRPVGPRIATVHDRGAVGIAPDGDSVVTAGRYGTSVVDVTAKGRVSSLCGMVSRRLSVREWQDVAPGERFRWPC
nr:toll/interleukin-1 receptor domain-containing protein [Streptomyces sp. HNM0575]